HLGELLALEAARDGADREKARAAGGFGALKHRPGDGGIVVHRAGVRHGADGGEPARRGGLEPRGDVFLVFVSGLSEMNVDVDEAGRDDAPLGVDDLGAFWRGNLRIDSLDHAAFDEEIFLGVDSIRRIDDPTALNEPHDERAYRSGRPESTRARRFRWKHREDEGIGSIA